MRPILLDLPKQILTPRLLLRSPMPGDGAKMNEGLRESWERLQPWMPWARTPEMPSVADSEERARNGYAKYILREDLWTLIFDRQTGEYIGGTGLHRINWNIPAVEIGFWIRTSREGKGYISESTNAMTRFAFDFIKCKRVEIRCNSRNEKSRKVIEGLGFILEGTLKNNDSDALGGGDHLVFARTDAKGLPALEVNWE